MKMKLALVALLAAFAGSVVAEPLVKEHVDQNAKWLLHIDFDQFRASRFGQFLINDVIVKQVEDRRNGRARGGPGSGQPDSQPIGA